SKAKIVFIAEAGKQETTFALDGRISHLKSREISQRHPKQLKTAPFKTNGFRRAVPDDFTSLDLPEDRFVWIFFTRFAGCIDTIVKGCDLAIAAFGALCGKAGIVSGLNTKAINKTIAETICYVEMIRIDAVAIAFDNFDITARSHAACLLIVSYLIGNQPVAVIFNTHGTLSSDQILITIINQLIRLQKHTRVWVALIVSGKRILRQSCRR